jgi:hypothetical protein
VAGHHWSAARIPPCGPPLLCNKLYTDAMMNAMQQNCTNIAVLQRYMNFCQRLSQDADPG